MEYDVESERCLRFALDSAHAAPHTSGGRYAFFPIRTRTGPSEKQLIEYCSEWFSGRPGRGRVEVTGYRPFLASNEDRSLIGLHSSGVYAQGRVDSVSSLSVIAACYSLGIPAAVGKRLPSSAPFWDAIERLGFVKQTGERPGTASHAFIQVKDKRKNFDATSSYKFKLPILWPDEAEQMYQASRRELTVQPFDRFRSVSSLAEADELIKMKMRAMEPSLTNSYVCVELTHPLRIFVGEFIWFFTQVWPDCELTKCGTRWRPRCIPCGSLTGSVQLASSESQTGGGSKCISAGGKRYLIQALMPLMAACSLKLDPQVAAKTESFRIFWSTMSADPSRIYRTESLERNTVVDLAFFKRNHLWVSPEDRQFWHACNTASINSILEKQFFICLMIFNSRNGFWSGASALPHVQLTRDDFVDFVSGWTPDVCFESAGFLKARPAFLPKGGISMDESGKYFSIQTSNAGAIAMLIMLAAFLVGVPPHIAALCQYANLFWDYMQSLHSLEYVMDRRLQLLKGQKSHTDLESRLLAFKLSSFKCLVLPTSSFDRNALTQLGFEISDPVILNGELSCVLTPGKSKNIETLDRIIRNAHIHS